MTRKSHISRAIKNRSRGPRALRDRSEPDAIAADCRVEVLDAALSVSTAWHSLASKASASPIASPHRCNSQCDEQHCKSIKGLPRVKAASFAVGINSFANSSSHKGTPHPHISIRPRSSTRLLREWHKNAG
jgi:hypothetical protein